MNPTMELHVTLIIEAKDEYEVTPGQWAHGGLPRPGNARRHIQDIVADETKNNTDIGWRVTNIARLDPSRILHTDLNTPPSASEASVIRSGQHADPRYHKDTQ